jgi:hypothetical protein
VTADKMGRLDDREKDGTACNDLDDDDSSGG